MSSLAIEQQEGRPSQTEFVARARTLQHCDG
jgi:hypothetical protein